MTASPQPPPTMQTSERRTLTFLLGDDQLGGMLEDVVRRDFSDRFDLEFFRFRSEAGLWRLAFERRPDLVFLYIGNIEWHPLPRGSSGVFQAGEGAFAQWIKILGFFSARFEIPVIATQGTDLRADAERAGVIFLEAPFKAAELMSAVRTALRISPESDRSAL